MTEYNKINAELNTIDQEAKTTSYNPTFSDNDCQNGELELLKGDAIGGTLYSERFVLNTLLRLGQLEKDLQEADDMERDLCSLWDMTVEEDIVKYLLNHDVLEMFGNIIKNTEDKRLTEILVGIIGNMCSIQVTTKILTDKPEVVNILLDLTSCMDSLTLEQLMRFISVVFVKISEDQIEMWYRLVLQSENFLENICFILNNSAIHSLIFQTLEALNAILTKLFVFELSAATENCKSIIGRNSKTNFEEVFVQTSVIESTIEAFKTLFENCCSKTDYYEDTETPEITHKEKQIFCNIHSILSQFEQLSRDAYESSNDEILNCFKGILFSITEVDSVKSWHQYEHDVLETLNDVLRVKYALELY